MCHVHVWAAGPGAAPVTAQCRLCMAMRGTQNTLTPITMTLFCIPFLAHALLWHAAALPQVRRLLLLKAGMVRWEDRGTSLFMRGDAGVGYRKVLMPFMHQVQVGAAV